MKQKLNLLQSTIWCRFVIFLGLDWCISNYLVLQFDAESERLLVFSGMLNGSSSPTRVPADACMPRSCEPLGLQSW